MQEKNLFPMISFLATINTQTLPNLSDDMIHKIRYLLAMMIFPFCLPAQKTYQVNISVIYEHFNLCLLKFHKKLVKTVGLPTKKHVFCVHKPCE